MNLHHGLWGWLAHDGDRSCPGPGDPLRLGEAETAGRTDRGRVRRQNEDSFAIVRLRRSPARAAQEAPALLLALADGMGGLTRGAEASATALRTFIGQLRRHGPTARLDPLEGVDLDRTLFDGFQAAHRAVQAAAAAEAAEMGTTLTVAYVVASQAHVCHVGDSRCYLVRDGVARRLTRDHTVAQDLVDVDLSNPEALHARWSHLLTNAVGVHGGPPKVERHVVGVERGDLLLLCSDGVTRYISDPQIATLSRGRTAGETCDALIDTAIACGGADNITAVAARF